MALDAAWKTFQAGEGREAGTALLMIPGPKDAAIRVRWYVRDAIQMARNEIGFERATGALIESARDADKPLGQRIADNMLAVHRGRFFGAPFALLFALAALAMLLFAATGLTLYVLRRRAARRNRSPARIDEPALLRPGRGAVTSSQGP